LVNIRNRLAGFRCHLYHFQFQTPSAKKTLFQQSLFCDIFQSFYMVSQFTILHCIVILQIIMMISDTIITSPRILVLTYTPVTSCYENRRGLLLFPLLILGLFTFSQYKLKEC
jgi:hypothetical protein